MKNPPEMTDYYLIETKDLNGERGVGDGLGKRGDPGQRITSYINVSSVDEYTAKVENLGGQIIQPKVIVLGWGYLVVWLDTEDNMFGLW
ncbi:VOC family protein [Chloroflexota bacterium]